MIIQIFEDKNERKISYVVFLKKNEFFCFEFFNMNLKKQINLNVIKTNSNKSLSCYTSAKNEFFVSATNQILNQLKDY